MSHLLKSCVELNSVNDTTDWALNATDSPYDVYAISMPPFLSYKELDVYMSGNTSILYYRYCGPLLVLMKVFAKYIIR